MENFSKVESAGAALKRAVGLHLYSALKKFNDQDPFENSK